MNTNIRIIKRSQRDAQQQRQRTVANRAPETRAARHATRDITGHVTNWINEFKQRHTPDPRRAFANLFVEPATSTVD